jgi:hypothetical protein
MPTTPSEDVPAREAEEREEEYTIWQHCGADLLWHRCPEGERQS